MLYIQGMDFGVSVALLFLFSFLISLPPVLGSKSKGLFNHQNELFWKKAEINLIF